MDLKSKTIKGFLRIKADNYHFSTTLNNYFSFHTTKKHDSFDCLNDDLQQWELEFPNASEINVESLINSSKKDTKGTTPIYEATIAVDTDNEFLWNKFSNNTTAAISWIENLFLNMNVIYESEVNLRLLIGTTIIRIDNSPENNPDFNADPDTFNDGLVSFADYWKVNQTSVNRVFAMLLAGRGISNGGFSGVAYVNAYCNNSFSYSFNKLGSSFPASTAALFVGHELGHNFGSSHTHCERLANNGADFVDHCYSNQNNSCFVGTTSCPSGGQGTMMSYCHAPANGFDGNGPAQGPPGSCNTSTDVHDLIASKMTNIIQNNFPNCIQPFSDFEDLIFLGNFDN
ncbi:MAG: hypothetical protein JKY19_13175 [Alcanivoracaceae bacterium]|nr:hypothetical protein [Alcanivoracaceae bacterium]